MWKDERLRHQLRNLITLFTDKILDRKTFHLRLFFDDDWTVEILGLYDLDLQGIKITDDESTNRWYLEETIKKKEEQVNE